MMYSNMISAILNLLGFVTYFIFTIVSIIVLAIHHDSTMLTTWLITNTTYNAVICLLVLTTILFYCLPQKILCMSCLIFNRASELLITCGWHEWSVGIFIIIQSILIISGIVLLVMNKSLQGAIALTSLSILIIQVVCAFLFLISKVISIRNERY